MTPLIAGIVIGAVFALWCLWVYVLLPRYEEWERTTPRCPWRDYLGQQCALKAGHLLMCQIHYEHALPAHRYGINYPENYDPRGRAL